MVVRLLGMLMVGIALLILRRPRSFADWTTRVNSDAFDRDTSIGERRFTTAITITAALAFLMLGAYYLARGAAALPE